MTDMHSGPTVAIPIQPAVSFNDDRRWHESRSRAQSPMPSAASPFSKPGRLAFFLLLAVTSFSTRSLAAEQPYSFTKEGSRYTFRLQFIVEASPDEVLDVLYPFPSLKQYSQAATSVESLDTGPDWQTVRFTYATGLWSVSTTFRRELDRASHRIRFRMLEARRTGLPMPLPVSSSGEYRLEPTGGGVRVTYVQTTEMRNTLLTGPWMARAHSEAILFSEDLENYVRSRLHADRASIGPRLACGTETPARIPLAR